MSFVDQRVIHHRMAAKDAVRNGRRATKQALPEIWPDQVVKAWEVKYGDRAIQQLVTVASWPDTLHSHKEKYLAAIRIIIHRDLGRARVARSLTGDTV